jgi:KRAB domain-containing zinc finger protein
MAISWLKMIGKDSASLYSVDSIQNKFNLTGNEVGWSTGQGNVRKGTDYALKPLFCNHNGCGFECLSQETMNKHQLAHQKDLHEVSDSQDTSSRNSEKLYLDTQQSSAASACTETGCSFKTTDIEELKSHYVSHIKNGTGIYVCEHCNFSSKFLIELKEHKRIHEKERRFKCDVAGCGYTCSRRYTLKVHKRRHTGERPYVCREPGCNYACAHRSSLIRHQRIQHDSLSMLAQLSSQESTFSCHFCPFVTSSWRNLQNHMIIHTEDDDYQNYTESDSEQSSNGFLIK